MLPIVRDTDKKEPNPKKKNEKKLHSPDFSLSGNKVHFISLGCPRNLVDTEVMIGILLQAGYEISADLSQSDFIIINTCGFLEASRNESVATIREALKERKESAKVIATGCMVQTHADVIRKECPEVHYLVGSGDVPKILNAVESEAQGAEITSAKSFLEMGEIPRVVSTPKHFAYLKIAEGCRKRCAFCIIPTIKGPLKSKPEEQILKELNILLTNGAQEIILIAQDLGDYGKDQGFKRSDGLVTLLKGILEKEKRHFWLRLLYLYPDEITPELIQLMKQDKRICHYLDMPIQHVNDDLLKSMRRLTNREQIVTSIKGLRAELPDVVIRTSLIVGFPGETEEQFEELCDFVRTMKLDNIGIFKYSNEPDSHAATLDGHISEEVKQARFEKLHALQQKVVTKLNKKRIGTQLQVLVEGFHPESKLLARGRFFGQCPDIDGEVIINDFRKVTGFGTFYTVEITDVAGYDLVGRVV